MIVFWGMKMNEFFSKGQVALLVILLSVLGLTLGMSVVSRSLTDLRSSTDVDVGVKTLAAAEAGAQYALSLIDSGIFTLNSTCGTATSPTTPVNFTMPTGIANVYYEICYQNLGYLFAPKVSQDETAQMDVNSANGNSNYAVYWHSAGVPAMALSAVYADNTVGRWTYNSVGSASTVNNFDSAAVSCGTTTCSGASVTYDSCHTVPASGAGGDVLQLRARPIGGSSDILICGISAAISPQNYIVTGIATSTNGTVRRVQVLRSVRPALSSVFDSAIFSGVGGVSH